MSDIDWKHHRGKNWGGEKIMRNNKQCDGKNCYGKEAAERVRIATMRRQNRRMRTYQCSECYMYHLTSQIAKSL